MNGDISAGAEAVSSRRRAIRSPDSFFSSRDSDGPAGAPQRSAAALLIPWHSVCVCARVRASGAPMRASASGRARARPVYVPSRDRSLTQWRRRLTASGVTE